MKKIVGTSLVVMLAAVFLGLVPPQDAFAASETSKNPTAKNVVLKTMTNQEIDEIIESCTVVQGKIYYSKFKTKEQVE